MSLLSQSDYMMTLQNNGPRTMCQDKPGNHLRKKISDQDSDPSTSNYGSQAFHQNEPKDCNLLGSILGFRLFMETTIYHIGFED